MKIVSNGVSGSPLQLTRERVVRFFYNRSLLLLRRDNECLRNEVDAFRINIFLMRRQRRSWACFL